MKTLKTLTAACLMIISLNSFAETSPAISKAKLENNAGKYVEAIAYGQIKGMSEIMDDSFTYRFVQGNKIKTYTKADFLQMLKASENIRQNCSVTYTFEQTEIGEPVVLINMKYENFTKVTRLTFTDAEEGMKISRVASWYK